jgi:magnesium-transporting ATPase (P-type)
MNRDFHTKNIKQSLTELGTDENNGLSSPEVKKRLEQYGANRLQEAKKKSLFMRILAQFKDFLVIILIAAAVVSVVAGDGLKDAILIFGILLVNVIISITQENRADNALAELKNMSNPKAKVKRDGHIDKIDSDGVVIGDIIILDAGDYIPADVRIIESMNLKIDEAALTGESLAVTKNAHAVLTQDAPLGDRINLASMGTVVTYGRGVGVVYATGMDTEMGKIAAVLNETGEAATPLQIKLNAMAKTLGIVCIITCAIIFGIGFLYGMDLMEMLMVSVSLAVAAVPEGVAIVATVILAIGVQKMVKSNVIVKRLRAVETLGSTTVICSDKTGTLTQNKTTVVKVFDAESTFEVTGTGYTANGEVVADDRPISENIPLMAEVAVLCKVTAYLLSCNIGEVLIILTAILFGLPVPLVATQLLFVNLLTDALPAFALGMERKEPGVMTKPPRDPAEAIINKEMRFSVALKAVFLCVGSLGAFLYGHFYHDYAVAISMCFFTLVAGELLVSYSSKTETFTGFGRRLFANKFLNISMGLSMAILVAVMYVPFCNFLFTTVPLDATQLAICLGLVLFVVLGSEFSKGIAAVK